MVLLICFFLQTSFILFLKLWTSIAKYCNCNSVGIQHFIFFTSRFSNPYLFLLRCCFLKQKEAALAWFHTEDLLCNCSSAVIITCFCCFSRSLIGLPFSRHLALSFPLPFPVSVSHCIFSSHSLSDLLSTHRICDFSVRWVSDRWQVAQISPRQGVTAAKCCLSWLMYEGNQCPDKTLVMLRHKALTSSAACNCFDNLITPNCSRRQVYPRLTHRSSSRLSLVVKAVISV